MIPRLHRRVATLSVATAMAGVGLTGAVVAQAHTARPAAAHTTVVVTLHDYMFNPMTVHIRPGTTVRWRWEDGRYGDHDITPLHRKGGLLFKGTGVRSTGSYSVTFTRKGTYYYECSIHPLTMQAKIIVS